MAGTPGNAVAAFGGDNTSGSIEVAPALNAHGGGSRRLDFASETFIAYPLRGEGFDAGEDGTGRQNLVVSLSLRGRDGGGTAEESGVTATALRASQGGGDKPHCLQGNAVRRLTPRECERLQGFPDDYTLIPCKRPFTDLPKAVLERSYRRYLRRMARRAKTPLPLDEIIRLPDGPRYKALGNSMAVPVMRWIGERIAMHARENRPEAVKVLG